MMRSSFLALLFILVGFSAHASPPPDSPSTFHDWFQTLSMPGRNQICCYESDCRFVISHFDEQTQHFEALVVRENFNNGVATLSDPRISKEWSEAWDKNYGDKTEVWITIPDDRLKKDTPNPTGHAVLCWTPYVNEDPDIHHGVYCFIPITAVFNEYVDKQRSFA